MAIDWNSKAAVRIKPRRVVRMDDPRQSVLHWFPTDFVPCVDHPLVAALPAEAIRELEVRELFRYLAFTEHLEYSVVNPATVTIAMNSDGTRADSGSRQEAGQIYADEAYHSVMSRDLQNQASEATKIAVPILESPSFLNRLRVIEERYADHRRIIRLGFTMVSETMITGWLAKLPDQNDMVPAVAANIGDHRDDEARHSLFYARYFERFFWPSLNTNQRNVISTLIPEFIDAFVEPDRPSIARSLQEWFSPAMARQIINDCFQGDSRHNVAKASAANTLAVCRRCGMLDGARSRDNFAEAGLL